MDEKTLTFYINHFLDVLAHGRKYKKTLITNIISAINNKKTIELEFEGNFTLTIFGKITHELLENNSNVFFVFKKHGLGLAEKYYSLSINDDFSYTVIESQIKHDLVGDKPFSKENLRTERIFRVRNFKNVFKKKYTLLPSRKYKEEIKSYLGNDTYKKVFSHFLSHEKLVLVNGILQIY